jgi:cobalt-precorrin 5A hydrolase
MTATGEPRMALVAITKHGAGKVRELASRMPHASILVAERFSTLMDGLGNEVTIYRGALSAQVGALFAAYDQIVFFVSLGAVVRLIAPHLQSKDKDPGVLVVDDRAQFVIAVLSGHQGGANVYAQRLARLLDATPVITTASDVGKTISVDILGRELGWRVDAPKINITRVSAYVVNGDPIALVQEVGAKTWWSRETRLPSNVHVFTHFGEVDLNRYKAVLWVTRKEIPPLARQQLQERLVVYRPPEDQP